VPFGRCQHLEEDLRDDWWVELHEPSATRNILAANSCETTLALADTLNWPHILALAMSRQLFPRARVVRLADGRLHAADRESAEILVATALLEHDAIVEVKPTRKVV
jgi:hypothetical protein